MDNKEDRALKVNKKKLLILGPNCLTQEQVKLGLDWISLIVLLGLCFGLKKKGWFAHKLYWKRPKSETVGPNK